MQVIIDVTEPGDPHLAPYTLVREPELLREHGLFLAESRSVVKRLLKDSRFKVRSVWVTETARRALSPMLEAHPDVVVLRSDLRVFKELAGFPMHRGCLALAERDSGIDAPTLLQLQAPLLMALEAVTNADNVGGIFRGALAFGAGAVVLSRRCCDPLYRKAIRTSVGASLRLPYHWTNDLPAMLRVLRAHGYRCLALHPAAWATPIQRVLRPTRTVLVVGNEGLGLSPETIREADQVVTIPMSPEVDSLNAMVAATIAMQRLGSVG